MYPYLMQGNNIVIVVDGKSHTISDSHVSYNSIRDAIRAEDWDKIPDLIEARDVVAKFSLGNVVVKDDVLYWNGSEMHNSLSSRLVQMIKEGFPVDSMINFMDNLQDNPSKRAVDELYSFMETGNMPITPDGCFLAYKRVRLDYCDVHSGSVPNKPSNLWTVDELRSLPLTCGRDNSVTVVREYNKVFVTMRRNTVDDNKDRTCSQGLHFCSEDYLRCFPGERVVILKINPRDVVSIPSDYRNTKGRCSRYEVIGEINDNSADKAFSKVVHEDDDFDVEFLDDVVIKKF